MRRVTHISHNRYTHTFYLLGLNVTDRRSDFYIYTRTEEEGSYSHHTECRRELSVNNLCVGHIWVEDDDVNSSSSPLLITVYLHFVFRMKKRCIITILHSESRRNLHALLFEKEGQPTILILMPGVSLSRMPSIFVNVLLENCNSCYLGY